jgi:glycine cleavage system H lipoate-binding protein
MRRSPTIPALINRDPEGEGWFFKLKLADRPSSTG